MKKQSSKKYIAKKISIAVVASSLLAPVVGTPLSLWNTHQASAQSLVDVQLLNIENMDASIRNPEGEDPYIVDLTLTGNGLADIDLLGTDQRAVFYSEELAGVWSEGDTANVTVQILPLQLDDIPALGSVLSGTTQAVTSAFSTIVSSVNNLLSNPVTEPFVTVDGLEAVEDAIDALNNLENALSQILAYEGEVTPELQEDGSITVDFSEGLGQHLDEAVNGLVVSTLEDVVDSVGALSIVVGGGFAEIPLSPLIDAISPLVGLLDNLTDGTINLVDDLAGAQVIGQTTVSTTATVPRPAGVTGEVPIIGGAVTEGVIDVTLLSDIGGVDTVIFEEEEDPAEPIAAPEVDPITEDSESITGIAADPEQPVIIEIGDETYTVDPAEDGSFEFPLDEPLEEGTEVVVVQEDEEGNRGVPATEVVGPGEPAEPIAAPSVDPITEDSESITGTAADPTRPVIIEIGDDSYTVDPSEDGSFEFPLDESLEEGTEVVVVQEDEDGNRGDEATEVVGPGEDEPGEPTEPIAAPSVDPITEDSESITGVAADPEQPVIIEIGDQTYTVDPSEDGSFEFPLDEPLAEGTEVVVVQEDEDGNRGDEATEVVGPGEDEPGEPAEPIAAPDVDPLTHLDEEITGNVDPENQGPVVAMVDGEEIGVALPSEDGSFTIELAEPLDIGTIVEVAQLDQDGNLGDETEVTVEEGEEEDEEIPAFDLDAPYVSPISENDTLVSGTRRLDSTLYARINGETIAVVHPETDAEVGEDGSFSLRLDESLPAGTTVEFYQVDAYDRSSESTSVVVDSELPDDLPELIAPDVDPVYEGDETATGTRDASLPLNVVIDGEVVTTVPAESDESEQLPFEAILPEGLAPGTEIYFYQTDEYGRTSSTTITIVAVDEDDEDILDYELPLPEPNPITPSASSITGERVSSADLVITLNGEEFTTLPATQSAADNPSVIQMATFEYILDEPFESGQVVGFTHVDDLGRTSETVEIEVASLLLPPTAASITEADDTITGEKALGSRVYALINDEYVGNSYQPANDQSSNGVTIMARLTSLLSSQREVHVLADTADILSEFAIPNETEFEVELPETYPAGTVIELYQANDEIEDDELQSDPTQIVVQPLQENVQPLSAPYLQPVNTRSTTISGTVNYPNRPLVLTIDGEEVTIPADEIDENGSFTYQLEEPVEAGAEISAHQVDAEGNPGESTTISVEEGMELPTPYIMNIYEPNHLFTTYSGYDDLQLIIEIGEQRFEHPLGEFSHQFSIEEPFAVGSPIVAYYEDEWGRRGPEDHSAVLPALGAPFIHTITVEDNYIYVTPAEQWTDMRLEINGEYVGMIGLATGSDRGFYNLPAPLPAGTEISVHHGSWNGNRHGEFATRTVVESTTETEQGIPPRDYWIESEDVIGPIVPDITDQEVDITGTYSTEYALVGILNDEIIYIENLRDEENPEEVTFDYTLDETLPAGTEIEWYTLTWTEQTSENQWYRFSDVQVSPATIQTVQFTPVVIDSIHTEYGVTTVSGQATGDTVVLIVDGQEIEIPVGEDGTFNQIIDVTIPAGTVVDAYQTNDLGAVSETITFDEVTEVLEEPTVNPITDEDTAITGTVANPLVPITITVNGVPVVTDLLADVEGNFTYPLDTPLEADDVVVVYQSGLGAESDEATVIVEAAPEVDPIGAPEVDPITEDSESITGTVQDPERPVVIEIDGERYEVEPNEDGSFEFPLDEPLAEGTEVVVVQEDEDGNRGEETTVEVEAGEAEPGDPEPIGAPEVDPITEDSESITGTVQDPERPVVIEIDGERYEVDPNEDGSFEFPLEEPLPEGTEVVVVQEDEDGNRGEETTVEVEAGEDEPGDPEPIGAPEVDPITEDSESITGTVQDPSRPVVIEIDGERHEVEPNEDGSFEFPLDEPLPEGTEVVVVQEDEDGNRGDETTVEVEAGEAEPGDPEPIGAPEVDPITEDSESITGTVQDPSRPVVIEIDGERHEVEPNEDGSFEFPLDEPLAEGTEVVVVQEDEDGNRGDEARVEVEPGEDEPGDPEPIGAPEVDPITEDSESITGTVQDPSRPVVIEIDGERHEVEPNEDGSFEFPLDEPLTEGTEVVVVQEDEDGNRGDETTVEVEPGEEDPGDSTPIGAPQVDPITEDSESITGTVEDPERPVVIEIDGDRNEAEPNEDGSFEFPLEEPLTEGTEVVVVQEDEDGNRGEETTVIVEAGEDPADPDPIGAPQVDPITEDSESITGTVQDPSRPVVIEIDGERHEVEANEDGSFEFPLDEPLAEGTEVVVVQEDENGNRGDETRVEVDPSEEDPADPEPIGAPQVDPITEDSESITGTVQEPSRPVVIEIDGDRNETDPEEDGSFEFPLEEPLQEGTEVVVVQEDEDGNRGEETIIIVEAGEDPGETPAIPTPVLHPMTDQDTVIRGVATDDTLAVILYIDGEELVRLSPDEFNSPFTFELDESLPVDTVVSARHVDEDGNMGGEFQIVVTGTTEAEEDEEEGILPPPIIIEVSPDIIIGTVTDPTRPIIVEIGDDIIVFWPDEDGSFTIDLSDYDESEFTFYQLGEGDVSGRSVTVTQDEDGRVDVRYDREQPSYDHTGRLTPDGQRLPRTATNMWIIGLSGLALLLIGLSTKVVKKFTEK